MSIKRWGGENEKIYLLGLIVMFLIIIPVVSWGKDCSSDFDCGIGYSCAKSPYSLYGVCMKSVNEFGNPTYKMPDLDSVFPKTKGDCDFDMDCPIGFYCHPKYKVCIKR